MSKTFPTLGSWTNGPPVGYELVYALDPRFWIKLLKPSIKLHNSIIPSQFIHKELGVQYNFFLGEKQNLIRKSRPYVH